MHIRRYTALKNKELIKLGFSPNIVLVCIFELCYEEFKTKSEHICFYIIGLKCCLRPEMPC